MPGGSIEESIVPTVRPHKGGSQLVATAPERAVEVGEGLEGARGGDFVDGADLAV